MQKSILQCGWARKDNAVSFRSAAIKNQVLARSPFSVLSLLVGIVLGGCNRISDQAPPKATDVIAVPAQTSIIAVPVSADLGQVSKASFLMTVLLALAAGSLHAHPHWRIGFIIRYGFASNLVNGFSRPGSPIHLAATSSSRVTALCATR